MQTFKEFLRLEIERANRCEPCGATGRLQNGEICPGCAGSGNCNLPGKYRGPVRPNAVFGLGFAPSGLREAKHPIPPLDQWQQFGYLGRTRTYRHDLPVPEDQRHKLRPSGINHPQYRITYNDPETEDIYSKNGAYLGSKKKGNDYTVTHYQLDPVEGEEDSRYAKHYQQFGPFRNPADAHHAARDHYDQLHGIERKVRQSKPKPEKPLPDVPRTQYHSPADSDDESDEKSDSYFGIGHGDNEEPFVVWAQIAGRIQKSRLIKPGSRSEGGSTHGAIWGHDVTDRDFKGRYEPGTGDLTIVKPTHMSHRELPNDLMHRLHAAFKNITHVHEF